MPLPPISGGNDGVLYIEATVGNHIRHIGSDAVDRSLEKTFRYIMYNLHSSVCLVIQIYIPVEISRKQEPQKIGDKEP